MEVATRQLKYHFGASSTLSHKLTELGGHGKLSFIAVADIETAWTREEQSSGSYAIKNMADLQNGSSFTRLPTGTMLFCIVLQSYQLSALNRIELGTSRISEVFSNFPEPKRK